MVLPELDIVMPLPDSHTHLVQVVKQGSEPDSSLTVMSVALPSCRLV